MISKARMWLLGRYSLPQRRQKVAYLFAANIFGIGRVLFPLWYFKVNERGPEPCSLVGVLNRSTVV